jgi:hypothetical protein
MRAYKGFLQNKGKLLSFLAFFIRRSFSESGCTMGFFGAEIWDMIKFCTKPDCAWHHFIE